MTNNDPMIEALAEAWASIDGKSDGFHKGREGNDTDGYYQGYCVEARELVNRLAQRGYRIVHNSKFERLRL